MFLSNAVVFRKLCFRAFVSHRPNTIELSTFLIKPSTATTFAIYQLASIFIKNQSSAKKNHTSPHQLFLKPNANTSPKYSDIAKSAPKTTAFDMSQTRRRSNSIFKSHDRHAISFVEHRSSLIYAV